jgi:putative PIN family toxin of toxin-antitoxin system
VRVVLDTNVVVSGLLTNGGVCFEVLERLKDGRFELCYSTEVLREYVEVLAREEFGFEKRDVDGFVDLVERDGALVYPSPLAPLKDPSDTKFLELAVAAGAGYLVTGNLKDFPRSPHRGVKIAGPGDFLKKAWGA